jgi:pantoate--beta-alanine ligase
MDTVTTIAAVRERVRQWRASGARIAFVPTMGNLHPGHISLIDAARRGAARFVASIFVNPMQFGPNEDFAHYPRTAAKDAEMLRAAGCDLMFMPDAAEIYPEGPERATRVEVPELSRILCGKFRPGHFEGVATVVAKLFNIVEPDIAVFGEKDFQQLTIIRRLVADLCFPIEIVAAPTLREPDGLAMSSRNQYLTAAERKIAPQLFAALQGAVARLAPEKDFATIERAGIRELTAAGFQPEYFSILEAENLAVPHARSQDLVVLAAARLGKARLIDNLKMRCSPRGA